MSSSNHLNYFVYAIGCQQNWYDAEKVALTCDNLGMLASQPADADLIIVLACSVRQKAVDRLLGLVQKWRRERLQAHPQEEAAEILVTACVLPADRNRLAAKVSAVIPDQKITAYLQKKFGAKRDTDLTSHFANDQQGHAFIPITLGCNNFCTFCAVPLTRGREQSRPATLILAEAAGSIKQGRTALTLLGQNVNSYGLSDFHPRDLRKHRDRSGVAWSASNPSPFVQLLWRLETLPGLSALSFLSPNPQDFSADLIDFMSKSTVFSRTLNLPLQSGSDQILTKMNRRYSAAEYLALVKKIKAAVPDIILSSDIIVGFPDETDDDFNATLKVAQEANFSKIFIGIYSPRAGTTADKLYPDNIPYRTKQKRFAVLNELFNRHGTALDAQTGGRLPVLVQRG